MRILVIGGGAAGMMAALKAKETSREARVVLLEKNEKLGKKIFITGKGRGNLTNNAEIQDFFENYLRNPRFLYSALYSFTNKQLMKLMEDGHCPLKVERGGRVFPVSDHAYSITDCLKSQLKKLGVQIVYHAEVQSIRKIESGFLVKTKKEHHSVDKVIVATGGLAYPQTGSTGDGYRFAKDFGLTVTPCYPSLVSLDVEEEDWYALRGLKLKNVVLRVEDEEGRCYYQDFGELDFTNTALGGPLILSASCHITEYLNCIDRTKRKLLSLHIDLKPKLTEKDLDERVIQELSIHKKKEMRDIFPSLLPARLLPVFLKRLEGRGMNIRKRTQEVSRKDREEIVKLLKDFSYTLAGTGSFQESIITMGGVSTKEINPKTMESKQVSGLYFCGEVLDIDAYTGGYNMQAAFSTGALAGMHAAKSV